MTKKNTPTRRELAPDSRLEASRGRLEGIARRPSTARNASTRLGTSGVQSIFWPGAIFQSEKGSQKKLTGTQNRIKIGLVADK